MKGRACMCIPPLSSAEHQQYSCFFKHLESPVLMIEQDIAHIFSSSAAWDSLEVKLGMEREWWRPEWRGKIQYGG